MLELMKGALLALVVNILTIIGWLFLGPWVTSVANVLLALILTGIYGLEDKWGFVLSYWFVQLTVFALWIMGFLSVLSFVSEIVKG